MVGENHSLIQQGWEGGPDGKGMGDFLLFSLTHTDLKKATAP